MPRMLVACLIGQTHHLASSLPCFLAAPAAASGSEADNDVEELDAETALDLLSLGIVNPVTKESAGAQYQQLLARQVREAGMGE